jgi:hypothetical protein
MPRDKVKYNARMKLYMRKYRPKLTKELHDLRQRVKELEEVKTE